MFECSLILKRQYIHILVELEGDWGSMFFVLNLLVKQTLICMNLTCRLISFQIT